jgi:hypothetical protein
MTLARFKDLCVDATDPAVLGGFWAAALGLAAEPLDDGDVRLTGPTPQHTIWINRVPEPRTVKQRMHLDVHTGSVADLEALGARIVAPLDGWTVMADPEGGEFCAFLRAEVPDHRLYEVSIDAHDARAQAEWWAGLLGAKVGHADGRPWWSVEGIDQAPFESIVFDAVPEPKTVKNRIHWDVETTDVQGLLDRGATLLRGPDDDIDWHVLADPEGNEFCAMRPRV